MKRPLIFGYLRHGRRDARHGERGVTMALVAVSMVAILGMALLSIDAVTLYLAREEAQRSADAAALAAARILSFSGMTGDPTGASGASWSDACTAATAVATAIAQQNTVGGQTIPTANISVTYPNDSGCATGVAIFGVNPQVTVKVTRQSIPIFFGRWWGRTSSNVSATATAEAYNPSDSGTYNGTGSVVPVQPRCVKPWIVPNQEPATGAQFLNRSTGEIQNKGIQVLNGGAGIIGESFDLVSSCKNTADCRVSDGDIQFNPPAATQSPATLNYVPALTSGTPNSVPSCATADLNQELVGGCDQSTAYQCGTPNGATVDLTINPGFGLLSSDTDTAVQCLIASATGGEDTLHQGTQASPIYPFQIWAGFDNPLAKAGLVNNNDPITSSNSIVSIPIYDSIPTIPFAADQPAVTIIGFLQVFINQINPDASINVTVLNLSGCSNDTPNPAVSGSSPVPIRLITTP